MSKKTINRIYPTYDEKLVKNTVLYESSGALYYDEACEYKVIGDEAFNLFLKGLIIVFNGVYYAPNSAVVTPDGTTEITFTDNEGEMVTCHTTAPETE